MHLYAYGLPAQTSVPLEDDVSRMRTKGSSGKDPTQQPQPLPQSRLVLRLELEELEQRLEAAFQSTSDIHENEPCIWACACFLVHGG